MIRCVPLRTIMCSTGHMSQLHWLDLITTIFFSMQWLWLFTFGFVAVFPFIYLFLLPHFVYFFVTVKLYSCDFYFMWNMFVIMFLIYESRFYACRDLQMDLNSMFFMTVWTVYFGFALTSTLKGFSSFQICCNHECNILCPTVYGT